ncbi:glutamate-1-semialdehyde-2,1-aminomutase [Methanocella sp. CWC-04]|uniref:Glutamate-1-semialdehyde 2,1-aminomutase n=1 Tax=Methanooceanicella nereidis TaxID=2052831 RepID=A0AAP2RF65_9EURY|nr:glutamate-1-semialdehyde 2,1-aminomutase [Methanocella sp. CWC-04]MCD1296259.1 glutamate-1-semialdehyde-2,1-aminomutase [Methanocella sp. CWC-04]
MKQDLSRSMFEEAQGLFPGGVSSPVRAIKPFPFYTRSAKGSHITDVDGNELIDYCLGYGPLILGHAHPYIMEAIRSQLEKGWLYGTPSETEIQYAKKIRMYYPSMNVMRFVNTGTEATMGAIRAARGFTGRDKIVKIEGGFHGAHDAVLVKAGSGASTIGVPDSLGVPVDIAKNTLQVPYNDVLAMEEVLSAHKDEIACVIMEPVMGNMGPILPKDGYLKAVRNITREYDTLLIFDEVITGFRINMFGAQGYYGIDPDLTTLGKIAGGGLPIGVFGGRRDIMETVAPNGGVYQAGTYNGNPMSLTAGMAMVDFLERERVHHKVNEMGKAMWQSLTDVVRSMKLDYTVSGISSMFQIFFGPQPENYTDALKCDKAKFMEFWRHMLENGVFMPPSQFETNFLSYAHTKEDLERTVFAFKKSLGAIK